MKRLLSLLPAIILLFSVNAFAEDDTIFVPHGQRNEIRYPGFYNVIHTCAVGGDRLVVFSRGEFEEGGQSYRGIFAHAVRQNKNRGTKPRLHFKGEGGSWGANALDSVWPGELQDRRKKFGLLFAALTPDYDGTPAKIVMSPFDKKGRIIGDQYVIYEIEESADNGIWVNSSRIAATPGPDSIGVAFSYHLRTWNAGLAIFEYQTRVYFVEVDFLGVPISELRQVALTANDGRDIKARIFRPAWINGRWVIPISSRTLKDGKVKQDQLRTATVLSEKIKVRTIDYANVTNITHFDDYVFSDAQFLESWMGPESTGPFRTLMVQRRDFSPTIKPDVRRYDTYYSLYNISDYGKMIGSSRQLKLDQWVPEMSADGRYIAYYDETITRVQPTGRREYFFVIVRRAELRTSDKYQFSEYENDLAAFSFKLNNRKITAVFDDLASSEAFYRITNEANSNLVRFEPSGSFVMPVGAVESGYGQQRRCWLDLLRFDPVDQPSRPSARTDHAMAYSPDSGMALMFGGVGKDGLLGDLWQWNGDLWREVQDGAGPGKRARGAMVYDAARKQFLFFGGYNNLGDRGDIWFWDGEKWTESTVSSPGARQGNAMAYCGKRKVVYLFGGRSGNTYFNDLWQWNGSNWTEIATTNPPPPRTEATITWDPGRNRLVLAGGIDLYGGLAETWEFNPADNTWVQIDVGDSFPDLYPMGGATAVYFEARETLYLFGGYRWNPDSGYTGVERKLQRYQPQEVDNAWRAEYPATWIPARTGHTAVYDSARKQIVVFGGWDDGKLMADTWIWDGRDWFNIIP